MPLLQTKEPAQQSPETPGRPDHHNAHENASPPVELAVSGCFILCIRQEEVTTGGPETGRPETVEKVTKSLFRVGLHEIFTSISFKIVGKNFARSVISKAHVLGNDIIEFYSVVCGRRNSLQEGFLTS